MLTKNQFNCLLFVFINIGKMVFKSIWSQLERDNLKNLCYEMGYVPLVRSLRPRQLSDVVTMNTEIKLRGLSQLRWNVKLIELAVINALIQSLQPNRIFEIGTFDGRTTLNMSINSKVDAHIHTIDLPGQITRPNNVTPGELFLNQEFRNKISQIYGDSIMYDFSEFAAEIDFIFIDGGHSYNTVVKDSINALKMIGPHAGTIVWHDYGPIEDVTRAVNELHELNPLIGRWYYIEGTSLAVLEKNPENI